MVAILRANDDIEASIATYITEMEDMVKANGSEENIKRAIQNLKDDELALTLKINAITPAPSPSKPSNNSSKKRAINEISCGM